MDRSESFSQLDIHGISAHLSWATVNIMVDSVPDFHMMVAGSDDDVSALQAQVTNGVLHLDLPIRDKLPNIIGMQWMIVTIRVPADWRGSFELRSTSGDVSLTRLSGTDLSVESISGAIRAEQLQAISLTAKTVSGIMTLNDITAKCLKIQSVAGTSALTRLRAEEIHLLTVSGQTMLCSVNSDLVLDGSTVSGHVVLEIPSSQANAFFKSISGKLSMEGVEQDPQSSTVIRLTTISGSLQILHSA